MNERSITERLRESQELRKLSDDRIEAMVRDVRLMRTEMRGMNVSGNLALGNSREAVEVASTLVERMETIAERLDRVEKRVEDMAQWAKTKGKE